MCFVLKVSIFFKLKGSAPCRRPFKSLLQTRDRKPTVLLSKKETRKLKLARFIGLKSQSLWLLLYRALSPAQQPSHRSISIQTSNHSKLQTSRFGKKLAPNCSSQAFKTDPLPHQSSTQTAWQWRTERAPGQRPVVPNIAFWSQKKLAACGVELAVPNVNSLPSCFLLRFSLFLPFPLLLVIASLTRSPLPSAGVGGYQRFCPQRTHPQAPEC